MATEPKTKRVVAFIDGQNLFQSAKGEWGYTFPNFDVSLLARAVGETKALEGWNAPSVRFYTGVPDPNRDQAWALFWQRKVAAMRADQVTVYTRPLRYRPPSFRCAACKLEQAAVCSACKASQPDVGREKGIDIRLALDIVRLAREDAYDVALIFSQDQDLSEAADEVRAIARESGRWIKLATAYPESKQRNPRGINGTDWIKFDRALYDRCIDPKDYRK